jgi:carboxymethylenebutenolidase
MIRTEKIDAAPVHGHLAHAERPTGGILLLPTVMGVDAFLQARARVLAEAGLTTLVWNPYPGEALPQGLPAALARAGKLSDEAVDDMAACAGYMLETLKLPAVGVLGFCLGGRYALLLAAQDKRIAVCAAFYPSIRVPMKPNEKRDAIARAAEIACPVHLVHGTADEVFVHEVFLRVREALETRPAATIAQVHPGAVHSFMRPDYQSIPVNASATRMSWPMAVAFLQDGLQRAARE